ncbi:MAG: hypothetical protein QM499_00145 [Flavobacteriaceae bacterium]
MQKHLSLSDSEFEKQFRECTFNPSYFNHEAHIRLAWIHIKKYGSAQACKNTCEQIKKFYIVFDKDKKFNTEITIASIMIVKQFIKKSNSDTFPEFIKEFPRLNSNFLELI